MRVLVPTVVAAALLIPLAAPGSALVQAGSKFTVCNFDDPTVPVANTRYPFDFLLSTAVADTDNRKVRKAVRSVQEVLRAVQIRDSAGRLVVVDGVYGPRTAQAVSRFQRRQDLTVDGKVGPQTWKRLGTRFCFQFH
jgi:peptidoglycan hydrolase-like protein with peptidoglycan-binding domain